MALRVLFGGTFDPVHRGHLTVAHHLMAAGLIEQCLFVPAARNPLKRHRQPALCRGY